MTTQTPYKRILYNELIEEYPRQVKEALYNAFSYVIASYDNGGILDPKFLEEFRDDPMDALEIFNRDDFFVYYGEAQKFLTQDLDEGMHTPENYGFDTSERILEVVDVIRFYEVEQLGEFEFDKFNLCSVANMFWHVIGSELVVPLIEYRLGILKTLGNERYGEHEQRLWTIIEEVNNSLEGNE